MGISDWSYSMGNESYRKFVLAESMACSSVSQLVHGYDSFGVDLSVVTGYDGYYSDSIVQKAYFYSSFGEKHGT